MRISRIHTPQALAPDSIAELDAAAANYLGRSLKLRRGDNVVLFNGDGADYAAGITELTKNGVKLEVRSRLPAAAESPVNITLVQAIGRGDRMDYSLQKATELGVSTIQPLVTSRVEVKLHGSRLDRRMAHWQGVVIAACEQSGRAVVPELHTPVDLGSWLEIATDTPRWVLEPASDRSISGQPLDGAALMLAVGPEGGFEARELEAMTAAGVFPVSMGPRTLRMETAGPAALAVLQSRFGDF